MRASGEGIAGRPISAPVGLLVFALSSGPVLFLPEAVGKELAKVLFADLVVMFLQGLPRGGGGDIGNLLRIGRHVFDPNAADRSKV